MAARKLLEIINNNDQIRCLAAGYFLMQTRDLFWEKRCEYHVGRWGEKLILVEEIFTGIPDEVDIFIWPEDVSKETEKDLALAKIAEKNYLQIAWHKFPHTRFTMAFPKRFLRGTKNHSKESSQRV